MSSKWDVLRFRAMTAWFELIQMTTWPSNKCDGLRLRTLSGKRDVLRFRAMTAWFELNQMTTWPSNKCDGLRLRTLSSKIDVLRFRAMTAWFELIQMTTWPSNKRDGLTLPTFRLRWDIWYFSYRVDFLLKNLSEISYEKSLLIYNPCRYGCLIKTWTLSDSVIWIKSNDNMALK